MREQLAVQIIEAVDNFEGWSNNHLKFEKFQDLVKELWLLCTDSCWGILKMQVSVEEGRQRANAFFNMILDGPPVDAQQIQ